MTTPTPNSSRWQPVQPLDFEPGTNVSYSDTGYVLLGFVINRVAGQFYGDLLQHPGITPLGMNRTRVISDTDIVMDRASGYEKTSDGNLRNQTAVSPALNRTADGSLYYDRARFDDMGSGAGRRCRAPACATRAHVANRCPPATVSDRCTTMATAGEQHSQWASDHRV